MKHIIILGDGKADWPVKALGGKTLLQAAATPYMDKLARMGRVGRLVTVAEGGIFHLQSHFGDMFHQFFMLLIAFLADSEVGNHCRQSRSDGSIQCGDASAAGDGIAARHFIQKLFDC